MSLLEWSEWILWASYGVSGLTIVWSGYLLVYVVRKRKSKSSEGEG